MNKTDLLLQMMEQPHRYTADQWQEILADEDCSELYTLMSKTRSAVEAERADEEITEHMIDEEWQRLEHVRSRQRFSVFYKIAAMFSGILMVSGIAYATIYLAFHTANVERTSKTSTQDTRIIKPHQRADEADTMTIPQSKLYDNVPLEQILTELSTYYNIKIGYRHESAKKIRLFYQWKPDYSKEKVVEMLNNFQWLQLELENDSLIVSSSVRSQP